MMISGIQMSLWYLQISNIASGWNPIPVPIPKSVIIGSILRCNGKIPT